MKKIFLGVMGSFVFVTLAYAQTVPSAPKFTVFKPNNTIPQDLILNMFNEVDKRIASLSNVNLAISANGFKYKSLFTKRGSAVDPWIRNPDVWTNNITPLDFTGHSPWYGDINAPGAYQGGAYQGGGTLISPIHIISSTHITNQIPVGKKIVFVTKDNQTIVRTVVKTKVIPNTSSGYPDITVALLDQEVPSTITYYPIISATAWKNALKNEAIDSWSDNKNTIPMLFLDQEDRVSIGLTSKDNYTNETYKSFSFGQTQGRYEKFFENVVLGDSSNPMFAVIGGKLALLSIHFMPGSGTDLGTLIDSLNRTMAELGGGYKVSEFDLSGFTSGATKPRPTSNFAAGLTLTSDKTVYKVADTIKAKVTFTISPEWTAWLKDRNQTQGKVNFTLKDNIGKTLIGKEIAFDLNKPNTEVNFEWVAVAGDSSLNGRKFYIDAAIITDTVYESATLKDLSFERNFLLVKNSGSGAGSITGTGINCGSDCAELISFGTQVTLTATPATGSKFTGWSGACTGMVCTVTINAEKIEVTANFEKNTVINQPPTSSSSSSPVIQNRRPVAVDGTYTAFDDSFNINLSGTDLDYNPLTFTPNRMVLTYGNLTKISEGKYVYTVKRRPTVDGGKDTFTFTVSDGKTTSKEDGVITINVPKATGVIVPATDADNDGVINTLDLCPNTPSSLRNQVNSAGCIPPKISSFDIRSTLSNDLRTVSGFELGKTGLGKIKFKNDVALSRDGGQIDIDSNVTISEKSVHIESSSIPELNKPATITLYNITEENPRILKDGKVCSAPQCVIESYSNGVLVFTVNGFSTYTVDETPKEPEKKKEKTNRSGASSTSSKPDVSNAELIRTLTIQLNLLIAELNRLTGNTTSGSFTADLNIGVSHPDVLKLQKFLNSKGIVIASSGPGSPGNETEFYGEKTADAVKRFQVSKGIISTGNVGPLKRAALNAI